MKNIILLDIDLRLFDGAAAPSGGEAPSGEGTVGDSSAGQNPSQVVQEHTLPKAENRPGRSRRVKTGAYSNVVFGKQGDASVSEATSSDAGSDKGGGIAQKSGTAASDTPEAKRQAYRELIEGEYREQYIEDTQRIVRERLKNHSAMEASLNAQKPIMDLLMQRYKVAEGDFSGLLKAVEHDTSYLEKAANEAGMPVEEFRQRQQLERDSAQLRQIRQNQQNLDRLYRDAEHVRALYPEFNFRTQLKDQTFVNLLLSKFDMQRAYEVQREAAGMKELYPGFDFRTEAADRNFLSMLRSGVPVKQAYEVKHMDEITAAAARNAAQWAGQRMKTKSARPAENGTSSQSAVVVKSDVSKLTRKDRAEIARRVARGEQISF